MHTYPRLPIKRIQNLICLSFMKKWIKALDVLGVAWDKKFRTGLLNKLYLHLCQMNFSKRFWSEWQNLSGDQKRSKPQKLYHTITPYREQQKFEICLWYSVFLLFQLIVVSCFFFVWLYLTLQLLKTFFVKEQSQVFLLKIDPWSISDE